MITDTDIHVDDEFAALIPPLKDEERDQLEANLLADGCRDPLVVWGPHGILLDGHNRVAICREHEIEFDVREVFLPDRDAAKAWIVHNQFGRRNLTPYQRAELALELESAIAAKAKEKQVASLKRGAKMPVPQNSAEREPVDTREEVAKVAGVSHDTIAKAKYLRDNADEDVKGKLRAGEVSVRAAYRSVRKEKQKAEKAEAKAAIPDDLPAATDRFILHHGEIKDVGYKVEGESVDWIITDPPYQKDHLHVYASLSHWAARVLKPGGSLICMVGQSYLPEVIQRLAESLTYHWSLAYLTPGGESAQLWERKVNTFWKPLLWFTKGKYEGEWVGDVCRSDANDKRFHEWGQSESGMADIVDRFTFPGETICDPFCGGGTTGVVAVRMNRMFIGIDSAPEAIETTKRRLAEVAGA